MKEVKNVGRKVSGARARPPYNACLGLWSLMREISWQAVGMDGQACSQSCRRQSCSRGQDLCLHQAWHSPDTHPLPQSGVLIQYLHLAPRAEGAP